MGTQSISEEEQENGVIQYKPKSSSIGNLCNIDLSSSDNNQESQKSGIRGSVTLFGPLEATKRTIERGIKQGFTHDKPSPIAGISSVFKHAFGSQSLSKKSYLAAIKPARSASHSSANVSEYSSDNISIGYKFINDQKDTVQSDNESSGNSEEDDEEQAVDLFASVHRLLLEDEKDLGLEEVQQSSTSCDAEMLTFEEPAPKTRSTSHQFFSSLGLPKKSGRRRSMSETFLKITQIGSLLNVVTMHSDNSNESENLEREVQSKVESENNLNNASSEKQQTELRNANFNANLMLFVKDSKSNRIQAAKKLLAGQNLSSISLQGFEFSLSIPTVNTFFNYSEHISSVTRFGARQLMKSSALDSTKSLPRYLVGSKNMKLEFPDAGSSSNKNKDEDI